MLPEIHLLLALSLSLARSFHVMQAHIPVDPQCGDYDCGTKVKLELVILLGPSPPKQRAPPTNFHNVACARPLIDKRRCKSGKWKTKRVTLRVPSILHRNHHHRGNAVHRRPDFTLYRAWKRCTCMRCILSALHACSVPAGIYRFFVGFCNFSNAILSRICTTEILHQCQR